MPSTATVTTRVRAVLDASMPLPRSICAISQPPKISPFGLVSFGIATVRVTSSPLGISDVSAGCMAEASTGAKRLQDQHAIAVAIKAIAFPYRFSISAQNKLTARKRRHQHEQRRTRQMEIRQQPIHGAK